MAGIEIHREPEDAYRRYANLGAATQNFVRGDPIGMTANQLVDCNDDASHIFVNEIIGFAAEPATGLHAGSRATNTADGFGAAEDQLRSYFPFNAPGLELRTRNFWATGAAGTDVEKDGTEIGDVFVMTAALNSNNWGVEETAPTYASGDIGTIATGDDASFMVVAILDNNMEPLELATSTQTAGDGWIIFRPIGLSQNEYGSA